MNKNKDISLQESLINLIKIVSRLRSPENGCPWDQKQTHYSLIGYLLEEANEVVYAIRQDSEENLIEELGDLLLQIIMHCQIGSERNKFSLEDVIASITKKLIRRHPHVFKKKEDLDIEEVEARWNAVKLQEKKMLSEKHHFSTSLDQKIRTQASIDAAICISKEARRIGFNWKSGEEIWNKVYEEIDELKIALEKKELKSAENELGDLVFSIINIGLWENLNIVEGIANTNKKILDRFIYIENNLTARIEDQSNSELKKLWNQSKTDLQNKNDLSK